MKGSEQDRKRSYSLIYRIYRRLRYIRFLRRKRKSLLAEVRTADLEEKRRIRQELKEHRTKLREEERIKLQYEKDRIKEEEEDIRSRLKAEASITQDIIQDEEKIRKELLSKEKAERKEKRRQLLKSSVRSGLRNSYLRIKSFRPGNVVIYLRDQRTFLIQFSRIIFNSTVMFLLSYFTVYILAQAATVLTARLFHYPTTIYYWEIYFNISIEDWYHDSVKTIFSSGPILALLTGIVFMFIYNSRKELTGIFKLFFLWGFLNGISMFFGAMLVGTLFESGIGHVISWMYVMDTGKVLYSIISIFMLVVAGMVSIKPFLLSTNTYVNALTTNRRAMIWAQVILPYLFGTFFLIALRLPRFMFYETFVTFSVAVSLIPVITGYSAYNDLFFDEDKRKISIDWRYFLLLVVVLLFYRGILNFGIPVPG